MLQFKSKTNSLFEESTMNKKILNSVAVLSLVLSTPLYQSLLAEDSATNTSRNKVDKSLNSVLPEDQSNESIFIERTAAIRRAITDSSDLSIAAQNVKIITLSSGTVVLRGPVESMKEKKFVENVAKRLSDNAPVKSYLEVNQIK
jgi:hypothetical protein